MCLVFWDNVYSRIQCLVRHTLYTLCTVYRVIAHISVRNLLLVWQIALSPALPSALPSPVEHISYASFFL